MGADVVTVRMAEMCVVERETVMKTTLGSCVGIILHDAGRRIGGLAHVMLPRKTQNDTATAKYADSAIPILLQRLEKRGCRRSSVKAYLVGGAQLFAFSLNGGGSIGDSNVVTARQVLQTLAIPVVFEDTGGTAGRTVTFENGTGRVNVRTLQPSNGGSR